MNKKDFLSNIFTCLYAILFLGAFGTSIYLYYNNSTNNTPLSNPVVTVYSYFNTEMYGGKGGTLNSEFKCSKDSYLTSIFIKSGSHIDSIECICKNKEVLPLIGGKNGSNSNLYISDEGFRKINIKSNNVINNMKIYDNLNVVLGSPVNNVTGNSYSIDCGEKGLLAGFVSRSGLLVDAISGICRKNT